jgi:hypothetical protein
LESLNEAIVENGMDLRVEVEVVLRSIVERRG